MTKEELRRYLDLEDKLKEAAKHAILSLHDCYAVISINDIETDEENQQFHITYTRQIEGLGMTQSRCMITFDYIIGPV